ncbi:MAG: hypothetical protein U9Q88_14150 [Bacillota bacterium]|nr:hypothetical protein [Bacillota bacterium]
MNQKIYKIMGAIFISLSGLFYTAERIAERLAVGIADAGWLLLLGQHLELFFIQVFLKISLFGSFF